jgi:hypothetical protein
MTVQLNAALNEPSLADVIAHIQQLQTMSLEKRSHWACSMRFVARALHRPPSPPGGQPFVPGWKRCIPSSSA